MNKYNYLSIILILVSFIFSIYDTFIYPRKNKYDDYFPEHQDKSLFKKIIWYLSQFTYQKQLIFLFYFYLKFKNYKNLERFLKIIAPPMMIINLFYFKYLFPNYTKQCSEKNYKLYELSFYDIFPHLLDSIIIILELSSLSSYKFNDIHLPIYFQLMMLISVIINYKIRKVWSYNIVDLKQKSTYKMLIEFLIYNYIVAYVIYKIKKK